MNIEDVMEWFQIADDDFDSAKILSEAFRKHNEIICYHCAQAVEKYLKGYLEYKDIIPKKTHNLILLLDECIEIEKCFENVKTECSLINRFTNEIRYPHRFEVKEEDVKYSLNAVERIRNIEPMKRLKDIISKEKSKVTKK
jgi:HEPN domain-containing protein